MAEKKTGRKRDFPDQDGPERLHIILPKATITRLEIFTAGHELTRNQIINAAILNYIEAGEGKDTEPSQEI